MPPTGNKGEADKEGGAGTRGKILEGFKKKEERERERERNLSSHDLRIFILDPTLTLVLDKRPSISMGGSSTKVSPTTAGARLDGVGSTGAEDHEEHDGGEQQTEGGRPDEGKCFGAEIGLLIVVSKVLATQDKRGAIVRVGQRPITTGKGDDGRGRDVRHQRRHDRLEEQSDGGQQARESSAQATAQGQETGEERADGEEEGDEEKGEHEAGEVIILVRAIIPTRQPTASFLKPVPKRWCVERTRQDRKGRPWWYQSCVVDQRDRRDERHCRRYGRWLRSRTRSTTSIERISVRRGWRRCRRVGSRCRSTACDRACRPG